MNTFLIHPYKLDQTDVNWIAFSFCVTFPSQQKEEIWKGSGKQSQNTAKKDLALFDSALKFCVYRAGILISL